VALRVKKGLTLRITGCFLNRSGQNASLHGKRAWLGVIMRGYYGVITDAIEAKAMDVTMNGQLGRLIR